VNGGQDVFWSRGPARSPHGSLAQMFDPAELLKKGREARRENRLEEAREMFEQAVAEGKWLEDRSYLVAALRGLGQAERDLKRPDSARKAYRRAADLCRELGDALGQAHSMRHCADIEREMKLAADAKRDYEAALAIYCSRADTPPLDLANTLRGFALLQDGAGVDEESLLLWQEASHLYETAGVQAGVDEAKQHIAFLYGR